MDQIYREQLIDHYQNPRNQANDNELDAMDASDELKNLSCGDEIRVGVNVNEGKVSAIKFKGVGCAVCISSTSIISEELTNEEIDKVKNLKYEDLLEIIGYEPSPSRIKCAHLGLLALQKALNKM